MSRLHNIYAKLLRSELLLNSLWGVSANLIQTGLTSAFFVILAHKFAADSFAQFLIANTVYQLVAAFSSMGLSQWFIREYTNIESKVSFTIDYFKIQLILSVGFYVVNAVISYGLYNSVDVRILSLILGVNILFDNLGNAIKSLNIAELQQRKTAMVLLIDSALKLVVGGVLFVYPLSIISVAALLVAARLITINLFIRIGSAGSIAFVEVWRRKPGWKYLRRLLIDNWYFVVIGSVSVVYWSTANIIISKMLALKDVANYEISFKIFSIAILLPIVASGSIFPRFVALAKAGEVDKLRILFRNIQGIYTAISLLAYAFVVSFAQFWLPFIFGSAYADAVVCINLMFLTFLVFPAVLLQANLIVALNMEKMDMFFNLVSLFLNVAGCLLGLSLYRKLSVVNYSVAFSFLVFHLLQDALLVKKQITTWLSAAAYYANLAAFIVLYHYAVQYAGPTVPFVITGVGVVVIMLRKLNSGAKVKVLTAEQLVTH